MILLFCWSADLQAQRVLFNGHAHNDYTQKHPLQDALEYGFFSIEVDVWRIEDEFRVSHRQVGLRRANTLHELYLKPLKYRVDSIGGSVYAKGIFDFEMMIDLKGSWDLEDLRALEDYLGDFKEVCSSYKNGAYEQGAVRILLSGNGGKYAAAQLELGYFAIDGWMGQLKSSMDQYVLPRISTGYRSNFSWKGIGKQPEQERLKMEQLVEEAHLYGRKIRFWAVPNRPKVWKALIDAGVDWINVDRLRRFQAFSESFHSSE